MSLTDWLNQGLLVKHKPDSNEIRELLGIVQRDLTQSNLPGLDCDWQLAIAYNAALQLAVIALAASGYRTKGEGHHFRAIQSLAYTVNLSFNLLDKLDGFRKMRNMSDYERAGMVSDQAAEEMLYLARQLQKIVIAWLQTNHPELM